MPIGPLCDDSLDSMITALQGLFGFAFSSCISATSSIISKSASSPSPVFADTGTVIVFPPQSSANKLY